MRPSVHRICISVLLLFFSLATVTSRAQQNLSYGKVELGLGVGPLFFLGDLGGNFGRGTTFVKDVNLPITRISKGVYLTVHPTEWLAFRAALNIGTLEGADSLVNEKGGEEIYRKVRNLSFRSPLTEVYGAVEFSPTVFFEQYEGLAGKLRPYGVIGIGMFKFNPQAKYNSPNGTSRWVNLQPLRLEGQGMSEYPSRKDYKLTQLEIPVGAGIKYYLSDNMYLGFEILHRKTFTDYVDDVSTTYINPDLFDKYLSPENVVVARQLYYRGNGTVAAPNSLYRPADGEQRGQVKNNDAFFSSVLRFGWRLASGESTPMQMRCPKF